MHNETIQVIPPTDYSALATIVAEYLTGTENILEIAKKCPGTTVGYYLGSELIGTAYGFPSEFDDGFSLDGIVVVEPYNAAGRGGKLLAFFEQQVAALGYSEISLGSADGYVERFYLKNGYRATELKILVPRGISWENHPAFPVAEVQTQGEYTKLVLRVDDYFAMDKDALTCHYHGEDSFFIFVKELQQP